MSDRILRNASLILLAISVVSIVVTVVGLAYGSPFLALFLCFPGLATFGVFRKVENEPGAGDRCPECGSPVSPEDSFCRVCGRKLYRRERCPDI
mgnify:CR=1 FL=1